MIKISNIKKEGYFRFSKKGEKELAKKIDNFIRGEYRIIERFKVL